MDHGNGINSFRAVPFYNPNQQQKQFYRNDFIFENQSPVYNKNDRLNEQDAKRRQRENEYFLGKKSVHEISVPSNPKKQQQTYFFENNGQMSTDYFDKSEYSIPVYEPQPKSLTMGNQHQYMHSPGSQCIPQSTTFPSLNYTVHQNQHPFEPIGVGLNLSQEYIDHFSCTTLTRLIIGIILCAIVSLI